METATPYSKKFLLLGMMLVVLLMVVAFFGWVWANKQNDELKSKFETADAVRVQVQNQKATAINEANARSRDAEKQSKIALARQLAAQAQALFASESSAQIPAMLLAVQSMRLAPSGEASQTLQNSTLADMDLISKTV